MPLPSLRVLGVDRKLAAFKPKPGHHWGARRYSAVHPVVDQSTWEEVDLSATYKTPIRDQGQHGSCTGHAGTTVLTYSRLQAGFPVVSLSCTFPYAQVNGGQDQGASVTSIAGVLQNTGTCLFETCGTDTIYQSQIPKSAYDEAANYKAAEFLSISTFEELCQALVNGFPVAFGVMIGNNFSNLDQNGVVPMPRTIIGGHALTAIGLKKGPNGTWLIKFQNSWSAAWGMGGFAYMTNGYFRNMMDAYAITHPKPISSNDGPPSAPADNPPVTEIVETFTPTAPTFEPMVRVQHDEEIAGGITKADVKEALELLPKLPPDPVLVSRQDVEKALDEKVPEFKVEGSLMDEIKKSEDPAPPSQKQRKKNKGANGE